LLNSDHAGHRLTFQLLAQSSPFAHLAAVYRNFDWDVPLRFVHKSAGLSDGVLRTVVPEQNIGLAVTKPALQRAEPSARICLRRTAQRKAIVAKGDDFGRRTRHSGGHF
jgi:hypothetical protein